MPDKGYHIPRLLPGIEEQIQNILYQGADDIIKILHEHFKDFIPEDSEKIFQDVLSKIAETISTVASLPELIYDKKLKKRIAFLPGYTTQKGKRITYQIKLADKNTFIPSDIAYNISGKGKIKRVKESVTNQALLYYYLLEHHENDEFLNGGTHQFLITNAAKLRTEKQYHLQLLQVFTGEKKTEEINEVTFRTIRVNFEELNSVEKLYNYFDNHLNQGNPDFRWPSSVYDKKGDFFNKASIYKMRGFLVALWYKVLHDSNKKNILHWFKDCIDFADSSGFAKLKKRLQYLQTIINRIDGEYYAFWYSLVFTPLPDFTNPDSSVKETLGSAMLMTNFELKPQFFYWIQPWIDQIYRQIRDFEILKKAISKTKREQLRTIYTGHDKYLPGYVQGDRLYKPGQDYKHRKELIFYYQELFGKPNDLVDQILPTATNLLNNINVLHLIQRTRRNTKDDKQVNSILGLINIEPIRHAVPTIEEAIQRYEYSLISDLPKAKYGFNSMLEEPGEIVNLTRFYFRIIGRLVTLTLYCKCNYTVSQIQFLLSQRKIIYKSSELISSDNNFRVCRANFFIEGLVSSDDSFSRRDAAIEIMKHISPWERNFIESWHRNFYSLILRENIIVMDKLFELNEILKLAYNYRF